MLKCYQTKSAIRPMKAKAFKDDQADEDVKVRVAQMSGAESL